MWQVKDKRIAGTGTQCLATVEYYRDRPDRDDHEPKQRRFESFRLAQKWLAKFPRDVWDGWAVNERNYRD